MPGTQTLADSLEEEEPLMLGGLNLIIMGPPLAGKSVQARLLADRYQLVVTTIDDLLMVSPPGLPWHHTFDAANSTSLMKKATSELDLCKHLATRLGSGDTAVPQAVQLHCA